MDMVSGLAMWISAILNTSSYVPQQRLIPKVAKQVFGRKPESQAG